VGNIGHSRVIVVAVISNVFYAILCIPRAIPSPFRFSGVIWVGFTPTKLKIFFFYNTGILVLGAPSLPCPP